MPSSILVNDGRRSASPDRRVTFGNIERYDIMTSNEIKNSMTSSTHQSNVANNNIMTANGNYVLTRLDNRIRKSIMLGFGYMPGDSVTYSEIVEFLLEFKVIANSKICTERQLTILVQSLYPKVVIKPSAKYGMLYVNLENKSDEVVKEELVRVTTEPILESERPPSASTEAKKWMEERRTIEEESEDGHSSENEEDEELTKIESEKKKRDTAYQIPKSKTPNSLNSGSNIPVPKFDYNRPNSVSEIRIDKTSVLEKGVDVPANFPQTIRRESGGQEQSRDLFETMRTKQNTSRPVSRASSFSSTQTKKNKQNTSHANDTQKSTLQRNRSFTKSSDQSFVGSIRDKFRKSKNKITTPISRASSAGDLTNSFKSNSVKKNNFSTSAVDVSKKINNETNVDDKSRKIVKRNSFKSMKDSKIAARKNQDQIDPRSSVRKPKSDDTAFKKASVRSSLRIPADERKDQVKASTKQASKPPSKLKKRESSGRDSRASSSASSSNSSTPNISRENSNMTFNDAKQTPTRPNERPKEVPQQEKDFVRIAKAFQGASSIVGYPKDNIEAFMVVIATADMEEATDFYLKLDDLYDHIRDRMIAAKDEIFDNYHTDDVTVDMSKYFDMLFKTLASYYQRVGCEMMTDAETNEKTCYLTHVKISDKFTSKNDVMSEETKINGTDDEEMISSFV